MCKKLKRKKCVGLGMALGLVGCVEAPPVDEGLAPVELGVIEGTALVLAPLTAPAPVVLFLYELAVDESTGTVVPVGLANLTVIPGDDLFQSVGEDGRPVYTGDFSFPQVSPAGMYSITGLVDVDGNFNPLTAPAATPGDIAGGYVAYPTSTLLPVTVTGGEVTGQVTVFLSQVIPASSTP